MLHITESPEHGRSDSRIALHFLKHLVQHNWSVSLRFDVTVGLKDSGQAV